MTVRFQRVYTHIWRDLQHAGCTEDETNLFVHLFTSPHSNMIGLFHCSKHHLVADLPGKWSYERLSPALQGLIHKRLVCYDETCRHILLPIVWWENPLKNPNQVKAAVTLLQHLPDTSLFSDLLKIVKKLEDPRLSPFREALQKRLRNRLPNHSAKGSANRLGNRLEIGSGNRSANRFETKEKEKEK